MNTSEWKILYDSDNCFWEAWIVYNGTRSFDCSSEADAKWLADILNNIQP